MAQGLDKPTLLSDIEAAYKIANDMGSKTGADPDAIITALSDATAAAIKKYMEASKVVTDHIIPPGHAATALPPLIGAGATVAPGIASGPNGDLSLQQMIWDQKLVQTQMQLSQHYQRELEMEYMHLLQQEK